LRLAAPSGFLAYLLVLSSAAWGQWNTPSVGMKGGAEKTVAVSAQFTAPTDAQPAMLFITATIKPGWHIYSITQPPGGPLATKIKLDPSDAFQLAGAFAAVSAPERKKEPIFDNLLVETHQGSVTWQAPLRLQPGADPTKLTIAGRITAQVCDPGTCFPPQAFPFEARMGPGVSLPGSEVALPASQSALLAGEAVAGTAAAPLDLGALAVELGFAFLGGLILNLMPCVLPVISLKILAFVQQAGESRGRVLVLNLWYSAGLLSVFLVLAMLAATAGLAWGEQFTLPWFKVLMTAVVFAMALSFLGVWEIPIPGFVGRGHVGQLQTEEGASGAFFKGVFTTILATPCSGPFLGPVFAYLLTQPPFVAYLVFGAVGLGMATPYLIIGAFPDLLRFLPRPGAWMETVQQLMGFLLLATVVYLFTTLSAAYFIPTLSLLVGLWFACWWIGRTPLTAGEAAKSTAWIGGSLTAAAVCVFAFTVLLHESKIPWQPFSPESLAQARAAGKTVMVDFSADWCLTCKANIKFAIDTQRVRKVVEENGVLPMLADWTDRSPVIKQALNELGYQSIPLLAIWPGDSTQRDVIVLTDLLRESEVLQALEAAGPSKMAASLANSSRTR